MTTKQEADLMEDHDPNLPYVDGSDLDGASWDQDEIEMHNRNIKYILDCDELAQEEEIIIAFAEYPAWMEA